MPQTGAARGLDPYEKSDPWGSQQAQAAASGATGDGTVISTEGYGALLVSVQPTSSWDGTLTWEGQADGTGEATVWSGMRAVQVGAAAATAALTATATTAKVFLIPCFGMDSFRARISGRSVGTVTVNVRRLGGMWPLL